MTTNNAYLGCITRDGYVIKLSRKGQRDRVIARFDTYNDMLRAWDRVTTLEGMVDVHGSKFD